MIAPKFEAVSLHSRYINHDLFSAWSLFASSICCACIRFTLTFSSHMTFPFGGRSCGIVASSQPFTRGSLIGDTGLLLGKVATAELGGGVAVEVEWDAIPGTAGLGGGYTCLYDEYTRLFQIFKTLQLLLCVRIVFKSGIPFWKFVHPEIPERSSISCEVS